MNKFMKVSMSLLLSITLMACSNKAKEETKEPGLLTFKEKTVEVLQDKKVNPKDFVKSSKGKVVYPKLDTSKVGKQTLKYIVTGEDGKKKTFKLTVDVKAKEEEKEDTSVNTETPVEQENSSTTEPTPPIANNGGSSSTTPAPQPTPQPPKPTPPAPQPVPPTPAPQPPKPDVCIPNETFTNLGNSNKWFYSENEAEVWAKEQIALNNGNGRYALDNFVLDNCGNIRNDIWTVDIYL